jgi:dephospho-CoA kinase
MRKITVIGLTGSIGMGKSATAAMLREMGIPVHDADAAVHALLAPGGKAVVPVAAAFPASLEKDDKGLPFINRQALGRIVFSDPLKMKTLEDILHPMVRAESDAFVTEMEKMGHELAVLDIPLLFETGGEARVDTIICVTAPPEVQCARVLARPDMTPEKFRRILASQMPDAEKQRRANHVVRTGKSFVDTRQQLEKIIQSLRGLPGPKKPPKLS